MDFWLKGIDYFEEQKIPKKSSSLSTTQSVLYGLDVMVSKVSVHSFRKKDKLWSSF